MCYRILIATSLVAATAGAVRAEDTELSDAEVFERVFAKPARAAQMPVIVEIDGTRVGSTVVIRTQTGDEVATAAIVSLLADARLDSETLAKLSRSARVSVAEMRAAGIGVQLDEQRLALVITIPATRTRTTSHTLGPGVPEGADTAIAPSAVSGYINVTGRAATQQPGELRNEGVLNVRGWVLAARGVANELSGVSRGDILLSHDVPASALRYLAGDFAVSGTSVVPGYAMLGIGVTRNFALQPYRRIQPVGVFAFTLDTPSRVTVVVDGAPTQTLDLPAGRHDVRDLPLASGVTDVELVIHGATGGERRLRFTAINPGELLAPGIVQFSIGAGFPQAEGAFGTRDYSWWRPILAARRRWGISSHVTVGFSLDGDLDRQVVGASLTLGTKHGNIALESAASRDRYAGAGNATSARYDYARATSGTSSTTFTVVARHFAAGYRSLATLDVNGGFLGDVSAVAGTRLRPRTFARANVRYQVARDGGDGDAREAGVTLSRAMRSVTVDATFGLRDTATTAREARVFVNALWRLSGRRGTVRTASRGSTQGALDNEVRYRTHGGAQPRDVVASIAVQQSTAPDGADGTYGADASVAYTHERFVAATSAATSAHGDGEVQSPRADIEIGTAIAFAGSRVAWSRPINGSFVIVDRNAPLAKQMVGVNSNGGQYAARADRFGPAVVVGLEPYRVGALRVEAPDLPVGMSLGEARYTVLPSYQSGTVISVGEPGTVYLRGTLQHADGTPVALAVGELVVGEGTQTSFNCADASVHWQDRLDCLTEAPRHATSWLVMTNSAGRFSVTGIAPGRYELKLPDGRPVSIVIPADHAGVFAAGTLRVD